MSIRAAIKSASAGLLKREKHTLPECGVEVQIRGLMAGETHRAGEAKGFKQVAIMVALAVEDPETGQPIWNANNLDSVQEIEALSPVDMAFLTKQINRLSGGGKIQAMLADPSTNGMTTTSSSDSPSPSDSVVPSGS